jgi:hypothetical protein
MDRNVVLDLALGKKLPKNVEGIILKFMSFLSSILEPPPLTIVRSHTI